MIKSAEDTAILHENARETDQLLKKLPEAINQLNNEEQALIRALYIDGISIREYARMHGVYHRSIAYRRDKILKKLLDILQSEH